MSIDNLVADLRIRRGPRQQKDRSKERSEHDWFQGMIDKRTALLRRLKEVFRSLRSQPVERVIDKINPILGGWVGYFAVGNSSQCFSFVRLWVEKKVRRHLARARRRQGFGWKRWSTEWLNAAFGLYDNYKLRRLKSPRAVAPAR